MVSVCLATKHTGVGIADCGHLIVRQNHLAVGQRVFCGQHAALATTPEDDLDAKMERDNLYGATTPDDLERQRLSVEWNTRYLRPSLATTPEGEQP